MGGGERGGEGGARGCTASAWRMQHARALLPPSPPSPSPAQTTRLPASNRRPPTHPTHPPTPTGNEAEPPPPPPACSHTRTNAHPPTLNTTLMCTFLAHTTHPPTHPKHHSHVHLFRGGVLQNLWLRRRPRGGDKCCEVVPARRRRRPWEEGGGWGWGVGVRAHGGCECVGGKGWWEEGGSLHEGRREGGQRGGGRRGGRGATGES